MADESFTTFDPTAVEDQDETGELAEQSLENLDAATLNPLSPEIISRQATINIGRCPVSRLLPFFSLVEV